MNLPLVPLQKTGAISDDTRIRAAIPTLKYLMENGAKVLLTSHLVSARPLPALDYRQADLLAVHCCQRCAAILQQAPRGAAPPFAKSLHVYYTAKS